MEMPWYSVRSFLFLFFCLEAALGQDIYESDFCLCYGNILESSIPKVTDHSYVKVYSQQLRDINSSILKDTLALEDFMDMDQDTC